MIGPVESAIFTNQQLASVASDKNAAQNRLDLQNSVAAEATNDKEKEVLEVRPTEENHKLNPDREHQRDEADSENPKDREKNKNDEDEDKAPLTHLDIKV